MILRLHYLLPALLFSALISGCADWDYYSQSIGGHLDLMQRRQDIVSLVKDEDTAPGLKGQLQEILHIREFASTELALPNNDSYRSWADLERPYVLWNVVAAGEFSLQPKLWCFPFAGCLPYRGFYRQNDAVSYARQLRTQGYDVYVYGVPAYSTLNWFDDPVLNTFGLRSPETMAALIFHELAHQQLYLPGDAAFNEAFAVAVETEGVLRWLETHGTPASRQQYLQRQQQELQFISLLMTAREQLEVLYRQSLPWREKRVEKQLILRRLEARIQDFRQQWGGFPGQNWAGNLSNARLASVATYHERAGAFRELLRLHGGDFAAFYRAAADLSRLPAGERNQALDSLSQRPALVAQQVQNPQ